ncbi:hypothetical protein [Prosthecobacter debontii]|nr:hypothetical protein [Prosthecobacter debontii]
MAQTHLRGVTSSTSLSTTYTWTTENRLAGVTRSDAKSYGYTYDYRIRRVGTVSEESGQAAKHTAILFSGGLSVAEYEGSSLQTQITTPAVNTVNYVRGPDMGGGVAGLLYSTRTETGGEKTVRLFQRKPEQRHSDRQDRGRPNPADSSTATDWKIWPSFSERTRWELRRQITRPDSPRHSDRERQNEARRFPR